MKVAFTGKGGVGKSTISGLVARRLRDGGEKVLAIDADPDMNLGLVLGLPDPNITPIIEYKELIAERTETEAGKPSPFFKMNPKVDDIPETYWVEHEGIRLLVMGTTYRGGGGCACPENAFLRSLLSHLVVGRNESVVLDMEAGIEHLGRGTAVGMDVMCVVVEPSLTSIETARRIHKLSRDIGIKKVVIIGNKVETEEQKRFIHDHAGGIEIAGMIGYSDEIHRINLGKANVLTVDGPFLDEIQSILDTIG
ncbi:MAG: ArsA-related P-loop ATPase [Spirochaetia bacterium]